MTAPAILDLARATSDVGEGIISALYASEINIFVSTFWDGGYDLKIGDPINGFRAEGNCDDWPSALHWLRDQAIIAYPDSDFAKVYAATVRP